MCAAKGEPMSHFFAFGDDVIDLHLQIGKAF
jgi:hypothetical protein